MAIRSMDLWPFDLRRFGNCTTGSPICAMRAIESYARYYLIAWPEEERDGLRGRCAAPRCMRCSPPTARSTAQKFGWERPNYFLRDGEKGSTEPSSAPRSPPWSRASTRRSARGVALIDHVVILEVRDHRAGGLALLNGSRPATSTRAAGAVVYTQLLQCQGRDRGRPHHHAADRGNLLRRDRLRLRRARRRLDQKAHAARRLGRLQGRDQRLRGDQSLRPARARRAEPRERERRLQRRLSLHELPRIRDRLRAR